MSARRKYAALVLTVFGVTGCISDNQDLREDDAGIADPTDDAASLDDAAMLMPDLSPFTDLLPSKADFRAPIDLGIPPDSAAPVDEGVPPDFALTPDLSFPRDLALPPDLNGMNCGALGQTCCGGGLGGGGYCTAAFTHCDQQFLNSTCVSCGAQNQPCCDGNQCITGCCANAKCI